MNKEGKDSGNFIKCFWKLHFLVIIFVPLALCTEAKCTKGRGSLQIRLVVVML
jgi:hypothetical protein